MSAQLNVTAALKYIDQVKWEFQSEASDVFEQFILLMKDFKDYKISTTEVIQGIVHLFHGKPSLLQGFNAFLPPGYRIELSTNPADPDAVFITTPSGTTT